MGREGVAIMELHTLIECANPDCKRGVRPRYTILGLCHICARAELTRLRKLLAEAHEVLEAYAPNHPLVDRIADALEVKSK